MNRISLALTASLLVIASCVTINVYFPEASAQQAADQIIDEVRGSDVAVDDNTTGQIRSFAEEVVFAWERRSFSPIASAQAQQPNFEASSPTTTALTNSLAARFKQLKPFYTSGAIGFTASGSVDFRDRSLIPLNQRNQVRDLVAQQNDDWNALYSEIAKLNGHPEWVDDIRDVFAQRQIAKLPKGEWYRDKSGNWQQK